MTAYLDILDGTPVTGPGLISWPLQTGYTLRPAGVAPWRPVDAEQAEDVVAAGH
jgi:hypothetical protein